jgi:DNA-binding beta-propeller fold protein YncE
MRRATLLLLAACACGSQPTRPCQVASTRSGLTTVCGFARPEDVVWVEAMGVLLVSEMGWDAPASGGALSTVAVAHGELGARSPLWPITAAPPPVEYPLRGDPTCTMPPEPDGYSGHGLDAARSADPGRVHVAVVGHGAREAIELFDLAGAGEALRLVWRGCVPLPPGTAGNDVAIAPDGAVYVTNYMPSVHGIRAWLALRAADRGEVTGDVRVWSHEAGWRSVPGSDASQPNGIAVSADGETLFVAENGRSRLLRMPAVGVRTPAERAQTALPGRPDNLAWSRRGTLLVAVLDPGPSEGWSLLEVDPRALTVTQRLEAKAGEPIRAVTSAAHDGTRLYLGSMADDRIAVSPLN